MSMSPKSRIYHERRLASYSDSTLLRGALESVSELGIECLTSLGELDSLAEAWNELTALSPDHLPTCSYPFVRSYLEFGPGPEASWKCFAAFTRGRLVGILPVICTSESLLGFSRSRFRTPANNHILSVSVLAATGYEARVVTGFLHELERAEPHYFDLLLDRTAPESAIFRAQGNLERSCRMVCRYNETGAFLPVDGEFSTYFGSLRRKLRQNILRREKGLKKHGEVSMHFLANCQVTDEIFEDFLSIEASGWKGARGSAILSSASRAGFYRALVHRLRQAGWLELHLLKLDEKTIAANLAMRFGKTLTMWKVGYDENFAAYGPGILLLKRVLERAFDCGTIDEVNFVTNVPMHNEWRFQSRPYYDVHIYPRRAQSFLLGTLPKRLVQTLRGVPALMTAVRKVKRFLHAARRR